MLEKTSVQESAVKVFVLVIPRDRNNLALTFTTRYASVASYTPIVSLDL